MPEGSGRTAVVAGGTRGIGRAIGMALARTGARVILTHRWGSADPGRIAEEFARSGGAATMLEVVEADVARPEDTRRLLDRVGDGGVDILVANVCVVGRGDGSLSARVLRQSLEYSAWPLLRYVDAITEAFGAPPRHVIAVSSDGPERFYPGYDYVAASKAVLEALCARLAARHPEARVNALRARQVDTAGYREMFGPELREVVGRFGALDVPAEEVAEAAVALGSGDLDGLSGEVLMVDRGATALDNLVATAPTLLGVDSDWRLPPGIGSTSAVPDHVLWIDAGVAPDALDLGRRVDVVTPDEARALAAERIPAAVVVGCDWRERPDDDLATASLLPDLLERARGADPSAVARRGIRVDLAVEPAAPGEALGRTLDRYWGAWHLATGSRLNAVRFTRDEHRPQALTAVRALLSGGLDGVRDQVLRVSRGPAT